MLLHSPSVKVINFCSPVDLSRSSFGSSKGIDGFCRVDMLGWVSESDMMVQKLGMMIQKLNKSMEAAAARKRASDLRRIGKKKSRKKLLLLG